MKHATLLPVINTVSSVPDSSRWSLPHQSFTFQFIWVKWTGRNVHVAVVFLFSTSQEAVNTSLGELATTEKTEAKSAWNTFLFAPSSSQTFPRFYLRRTTIVFVCWHNSQWMVKWSVSGQIFQIFASPQFFGRRGAEFTILKSFFGLSLSVAAFKFTWLMHRFMDASETIHKSSKISEASFRC